MGGCVIKLNSDDIYYIYNMFVEPYHKQLGKYEDFFWWLQNYNNKKWNWEGKDFPRVIALLEFASYVKKYNLVSKKVLTFNGIHDPELEYLPHNSGVDYLYDKRTEENDLHIWNPPIHDFDFCLLNQTLEHVYDPILCLQNIHTHLLPNSYIWITTPTISIPHQTPLHYYSYTPTGLGAVIMSAGLKIVECGWWGNREYLDKLLNIGWIDYTNLCIEPLKNDPRFSVITWVLAKKI